MPPAPARYLRHHELGEHLDALAAEHPHLVTVEEIGRSHEGRELWLVTVTDAATGPHHEKPAHWIDASIHADEVTGTAAALHVLDRLLADDPLATRARRERTFYVMPRVNPDGAEAVLGDHPRVLRSSVRPWPWRDGPRPAGLRVEDVDGDGLILQMRVADPDGGWAPHPDDDRLLVPRDAAAGPDAGPFFRVFDEGTVHEYDGFTVATPRPVEGLDLNRNYPAGWSTDTTGRGDFPGSEPEVQALLRAITDRPNICGANSFHTFGGMLLRPSSTKPDSQLPPDDVWVWNELAKRGTELTGYAAVSVFEDVTWDKADPMAGASDDWAYEHLGVYSWTTEFWDPLLAATGEALPRHVWHLGPSPEHQLAVARWLDEHHPSAAPRAWRPFEHPQLGPVELGGWEYVVGWTNPPPARLAQECAGHGEFALHQALAAPCLAVRHQRVEALGADTWRVDVGVANTGWLPTTVSDHGAKRKLVLPVVAELAGAEVVAGSPRLELGQLAGRVALRLGGTFPNDGTPDRALARWVVRGPAGTDVDVTFRHQRAGVARSTVRLG